MFKKFPLLTMNNRAALPTAVHKIVSKVHSHFFFIRVREETILTPEGALLNHMQRYKLHGKLCILCTNRPSTDVKRRIIQPRKKGIFLEDTKYYLTFLSKLPLSRTKKNQHLQPVAHFYPVSFEQCTSQLHLKV